MNTAKLANTLSSLVDPSKFIKPENMAKLSQMDSSVMAMVLEKLSGKNIDKPMTMFQKISSFGGRIQEFNARREIIERGLRDFGSLTSGK